MEVLDHYAEYPPEAMQSWTVWHLIIREWRGDAHMNHVDAFNWLLKQGLLDLMGQ